MREKIGNRDLNDKISENREEIKVIMAYIFAEYQLISPRWQSG
jgi:hypothetical protein